MEIASKAFKDGREIPNKYTCKGKDINPPLTIKNLPKKAKSLALIVDDPDAPGVTFVHWLVWNLSPKNPKLPEGFIPAGAVEGKNGSGSVGYMGPCPPSGTHRYFFRAYALDKVLDLNSGASRDELENAFKGHVLEEAELMGKVSA